MRRVRSAARAGAEPRVYDLRDYTAFFYNVTPREVATAALRDPTIVRHLEGECEATKG